MTTTKKELIAAVLASGVNPIDAQKAVETTLNAIADSLKSGKRVELRNFGVFEVKTRKEKFSNITGQAIPACSVVKFKAGKELGAMVASAI